MKKQASNKVKKLLPILTLSLGALTYFLVPASALASSAVPASPQQELIELSDGEITQPATTSTDNFKSNYIRVGAGAGFVDGSTLKHIGLSPSTWEMVIKSKSSKPVGVMQLGAGHMFTKNFGVEGDFDYYLKTKSTKHPNLLKNLTTTVKQETTAWRTDLAGVGKLYLTDRLAAIGKLGVGYGQIDRTFHTTEINEIAPVSTSTYTTKDDTHGFGLYGALGLQYSLSKSIAVGVQADYLTGKAKSGALTAGLTFNF